MKKKSVVRCVRARAHAHSFVVIVAAAAVVRQKANLLFLVNVNCGGALTLSQFTAFYCCCCCCFLCIAHRKSTNVRQRAVMSVYGLYAPSTTCTHNENYKRFGFINACTPQT